MRRAAAALLLALAAGCKDARPARDAATAHPPAPARRPASTLGELAGTDDEGRPFSLARLRGRPAVVVVYRGARCPLCVRRLLALHRNLECYEELGAAVVAITADPPALVRHTARTLDLDFPLVSAGRPDLEALGIWPRGAWAPVPAAFILDRDLRVRYRHIGRTAAEHAGDLELTAALRAIEAGTEPHAPAP